MSVDRITLIRSLLAAPLLAGLTSLSSGCSSSAMAQDGHPGDAVVQTQLDLLRQAMAPFHSFDLGQLAGWTVALSDCVESPEGAMGIHYGKPERLGDSGQLTLLQPEVLLYLPMADGSMRFVGVEYIIPAADWPSATPPRFLGQDLHYNPHQDIWALHVWIGHPNPAGLFADWNPDLRCDATGEA